jgi:hypothetical protein
MTIFQYVKYIKIHKISVMYLFDPDGCFNLATHQDVMCKIQVSAKRSKVKAQAGCDPRITDW